MVKPIFPPVGSRLRRFLDVLLAGSMAQHPEFLQRAGHPALRAMAEELREMHWPVEQVDFTYPAGSAAASNQQVTLYYVGAHARDAAIGGPDQ